MIIDESDERIFRYFSQFYQCTKSDKVFTICLTATAFEGDESNLEYSALKELDYKIYKHSSKKEDYVPVVHQTRDLGKFEDYRSFILKESEKCAVLIYATGELYNSLAEEPNVMTINADTPYQFLETMDAKLGERYPVVIINDDFGGRGLNFRAKNNPHGITMLILGTFPDQRTHD